MMKKLLVVSTLACFLPLVVFSGSVEAAAMVDFELPTYTAGSSFNGTDGWVATNSGNEVITPDAGGSGVTTVLNGSQSARLYDSSDGKMYMARLFDAGPAMFGSGSTVSTHMYVDGSAGSGEFYVSDDPFSNRTPAGISVNIGGNFTVFGNVSGYIVDSGVPVSTQTNYLLEIEMDLLAQSVDAYATNITASGARTFLGTVGLLNPITPSSYPTCGVLLISRGGAEAIIDDVDINIVPPAPPLLASMIDYEDSVYVVGSSVVGVDGWSEAYGAADAVVTNTTVLEGTKSLRVGGSRSILQRNFDGGTIYGDGTVISTRMMMTDGTGNSQAEFFFSHAQSELKTPAGIIGVEGGNFWIFGYENGQMDGGNGLDSGVPFISDTDYLVEMELDLTNQTFDSYVTDMTNGGSRTLIGTAELAVSGGNAIPPGDWGNSGYILITRNDAVVIFDDVSCAVPEPATITVLLGFLLSSIACTRRRKAA